MNTIINDLTCARSQCFCFYYIFHVAPLCEQREERKDRTKKKMYVRIGLIRIFIITYFFLSCVELPCRA